MKLEVNITKARAFAIIGVLIVLAGIIGVVAAVDKSKSWHSASQVEMASGNSLQEEVNVGTIANSVSLANALKTRLSGYCTVSYDFNGRPTCASLTVKAPASCVAGSGGTLCACPAGYTKVATGASTADLTGGDGNMLFYSCYLD